MEERGPEAAALLCRLMSIGANASCLPVRALRAAGGPVRSELRRSVRRSIGLPGDPPPRADEPDVAYVDPHSVVRYVNGDLPSMVVGGLAALLLQALHPLAMAGVAEHSHYRDDPLDRFRRTAAFVGTTTFGTKEAAREAIGRVKSVHERVRGIAPDGRKYDASDPELITWVHAAEMFSFLQASQRFGPRRLTVHECDAYYADSARVALELGARWVPRTSEEVAAYFLRMRPKLYAGPQALAARNFVLRGVASRPEDRALHDVLAVGAVSLLPRWARKELRIPNFGAMDAFVTIPLTQTVCTILRWAVT